MWTCEHRQALFFIKVIPSPSRMRGSSASTAKSFDPSIPVARRVFTTYNPHHPQYKLAQSNQNARSTPNSPTHPSKILFAPDIRPCLSRRKPFQKKKEGSLLTQLKPPQPLPSFLPYNHHTDTPAPLSRPNHGHGQAYLVARAEWLRT